MARFKNKGKLQTLSGLIGDVVVVSGKNNEKIIRSKPRKSTKKPSKAKKETWDNFTLASKFITPMYKVLKHRFTDYLDKKTIRDAVRSYYMLYAKVPHGGGYTIDYSKALMSSGRLRGLQNPQVNLSASTLKLEWVNNGLQAFASINDLLSIVAYNAATHQFYYFMQCARRSDETVEVELPDWILGPELHLWASMEDPEGVDFSNSDYLGVVGE